MVDHESPYFAISEICDPSVSESNFCGFNEALSRCLSCLNWFTTTTQDSSGRKRRPSHTFSPMCGPTETTIFSTKMTEKSKDESIARSSARSCPSRNRKKVTFHQVEIFELPITLGDNPSVSSGGPPMTLDWNMLRKSVHDLNIYEVERSVERRESVRDLRLSSTRRTNL